MTKRSRINLRAKVNVSTTIPTVTRTKVIMNIIALHACDNRRPSGF